MNDETVHTVKAIVSHLQSVEELLQTLPSSDRIALEMIIERYYPTRTLSYTWNDIVNLSSMLDIWLNESHNRIQWRDVK